MNLCLPGKQIIFKTKQPDNMANLLDTIKTYVTPERIGSIAGLLGENEGGISRAIGGLVPSILAGLLHKSGDEDAMARIFDMLSGYEFGIPDDPAALVGGGNLAHNDPKDAGGAFLGSVFGARVPAVTNAVAAFSGVKSASVSSLLGLVGPLLMGVLNQKIQSDSLTASGLINLLNGQKNSILAALPTGLASIIGLNNIDIAAEPVPLSASTGERWLWPLLLLLGLGGGLMACMKYCTVRTEAPALPAPAPVVAPAPVPAKPTLAFPAGTQEAAMLAFVQDAGAAIDKNKWFDFPEIMFDVNKATLRPESETKLNAVLAILNEYPALKLRIGGYTDTDGNDAANLKLSNARAATCLTWFSAKGIAADRLSAEGYGEQHPVAPNDTPENKAKNRRISFRVTEK